MVWKVRKKDLEGIKGCEIDMERKEVIFPPTDYIISIHPYRGQDNIVIVRVVSEIVDSDEEYLYLGDKRVEVVEVSGEYEVGEDVSLPCEDETYEELDLLGVPFEEVD